MKKILLRLLLAALLVTLAVGVLAACGGSGDDTYTVKIMDGTTVVKELTFDKGAAFTYNKADLSKAGYDVSALYTDSAMTEEYKAEAGNTLTVSADLTLYVKYTPKQYYIFIDYNGDDDREDLEVLATYGAAYEIAAPAERIGYRFLGYQRKVNKVWSDFDANGTFSFTEDIEIRVKWQKIEYVTIQDANGDEVAKLPIAEDGTVILPKVDNTATHYFRGYTVNNATVGELQADGTYKLTGLTASITAKEKWEEIPTYLLTVMGLYDSDAVAPTRYETGDTFTLPTAPTRDNYRFLGYTVNGEALTLTDGEATFTWSADTTIVANWAPRIFITVRDELTGTVIGTPVEVVDGAYDLSALIPGEDDRVIVDAEATYTYAGLVLDGNAFAVTSTNYTGGSVTVTRDWNGVDRIFIDVISQGASYDFAHAEVVNGVYTALVAPSLPGYYFIGFYTDEACTQEFANDGAYTGNTDLTVYAKWRRTTTITVINGTSVAQVVTVAADGSYTLNLPGDTATHSFLGFTCKGESFDAEGTHLDDEDLTVLMVWEKIPSFDIFFDRNDGSFATGEGGKLSVKEGGTVTLWIPTRADYEFGGWFSNGKQYGKLEGDTYVLSYSEWAKADDLNLTAKWTPVRKEGEQFSGTTSLKYFLKLVGDRYTYVLLTGHSYTFSGVTLEFGEGASEYITPNGANSLTVGNKKGAFSMTFIVPATETTEAQEITVDVLVKHYVSSVGAGGDLAASSGTAYLENFYGYATSETPVKKPLAVGIQNAFLPEVEFLTVGGTKLTLADLHNDYVLKAVCNGTDVTAQITVLEDGALTFDPSLLANEFGGHPLTLTFTPNWTLKATDVKPFSMTLLLNDGVNVYTNNELYAAFEDLDIHTINVLRNITAVIQKPHYATDDQDPINTGEHAVYYRETSDADTITINGNYFKIDGTKLPIIKPYDSSKKGTYAGQLSGVEGVPTGYQITNVQFAVFTYRNPSKGATNPGKQLMFMNDLYVVGNNVPFTGEDPEGIFKPEGASQEVLPLSGTVLGIAYRYTSGTINNCIVNRACLAICTNGIQSITPAALACDLTISDSKFENTWGNSFYANGQVHATFENSYLGKSGGTAIHFDDWASTTNDVNVTSKLTFGENVIVDNYHTGTESWFVAFGFNLSIPTIKASFAKNEKLDFVNLKVLGDGETPAENASSDWKDIDWEALAKDLTKIPTLQAMAAQADAATQININLKLAAMQNPTYAAALNAAIIEPGNILRGKDEEFNFVFVTQAKGNANTWSGEDNVDYYKKPYIELYHMEQKMDPHAINKVNSAFPVFVSFDNKLYMEKELLGIKLGFILGLYE